MDMKRTRRNFVDNYVGEGLPRATAEMLFDRSLACAKAAFNVADIAFKVHFPSVEEGLFILTATLLLRDMIEASITEMTDMRQATHGPQSVVWKDI